MANIRIWTSQQKQDDSIIAYANETIYKANPAATELDAYVIDLKT